MQGHSPSGKRVVAGKRAVRIVAVEPVGNYAVKLVFDDGHATGIFSWVTLRGFGERGAAMMATYEEALASRNLSRG